MATINDISNAAGYVGNVALGGGGGFILDTDTRPLQQLAHYTYLYNRSQYDQRQKDADEKIKALAELAPYDAATGEGKDKDEVFRNVAELRQKGAEFAAKKWDNPNDKTKAYFEFQKEIANNLKTINSATARQIKLKTYTDKVDADTNLTVQQKELKKKQAQKYFDETDINTLFTIPEYDLKVPKVGDAVKETVNVIKRDKNGNAIVEKTMTGFSITGNKKLSYMEGNNLMFPTPPGPNASQQEKDAFEQQKLEFTKTPIGGWQDASKFFAGALNDPEYQKSVPTNNINPATGQPETTTVVDIERIKSANPLVGGIMNLGQRYNEYVTKKIQDIQNGYYTDTVTGEKVEFSEGDDTVEELKNSYIDITKPLKPQDLSLLARFEKAAPDIVTKDYKYTGERNARRNMDLDFKVAWHNANKPSGGSGGGGSANNAAGIDKPAILFGQHIDRLKNRFSANGGKDLPVSYNQVDDKTRVAAKLTEGDTIVYRADGSYIVLGADGKTQKSVGTIDNLAQGFIEAVKLADISGGENKDGAMAEGFQTKSENYFKQLWGTTSGKTIWENWNNKTQPAPDEKTEDANNDEIPVITDKAGFDKLPSGTKFIYKGVTKIKS